MQGKQPLETVGNDAVGTHGHTLTRCAQTIHSGERWDFRGHQCSRKATVLEDGKWWCKQHAPSTVAARRAAGDEQYKAEREAASVEREQASQTAIRLSQRLGVGVLAKPRYFGSKVAGYDFVIVDKTAIAEATS